MAQSLLRSTIEGFKCKVVIKRIKRKGKKGERKKSRQIYLPAQSVGVHFAAVSDIALTACTPRTHCAQLTSAAGFTGFATTRLGSKGSGGPFAIMLLRKTSGLGSGEMNLTNAVLFSSSVNLKLST